MRQIPLEIGLAAAAALDVAAPSLAFKPALAGCAGGTRRPPSLAGGGRLADQRNQALDGVAAIHLLAAEAVRRDDQHAVAAGALAGQHAQPLQHPWRQRCRARNVEAQLYRGGDLVDVLPPRAGSADEGKLDFVLVERDAGLR